MNHVTMVFFEQIIKTILIIRHEFSNELGATMVSLYTL